jgi:hypothetical protein
MKQFTEECSISTTIGAKELISRVKAVILAAFYGNELVYQ